MSEGAALARALVADGVIDAADLVGGVLLRDVSRRNRNTIVSPRQGPGWFVKRAPAGGDDDASATEAAWYARLRAFPGVASVLSGPIRHDASRGFLLLRAEPGAVDLWGHHVAARGFPVTTAVEVGRALGALHRETRLEEPRRAPELAPFALGIHRPRVEALPEMSPATVELTKLIQGHPKLGPSLDRIRSGWRAECVIHYDLKWPNVLVLPAPDDPGRGIRLVDWEHAGEGEPAWDLGSVLAGYLTFWLYSIRLAPGRTSPADLAAGARFPLGAARPAMDALWTAYLAAAQLGPEGALDLRTRSAELVAARLILTAYEVAQTTPDLGPLPALHLQVAANVLDGPARAADRLLGLRLDPQPGA